MTTVEGVPYVTPLESVDGLRPLRICQVSECSLGIMSGVSNSVRQTAPHLRDAGSEVTIVAPGSNNEGLVLEDIEQIETPFVQAPNANFAIGKYSVDSFRQLFRERNFDVVHVGSPFGFPRPFDRYFLGSNAIAAAQQEDIPLVVVAQSNNQRFVHDSAKKLRIGRAVGVERAVRLVRTQERRMHGNGVLNLSPSEATDQYLADLDIPGLEVARWTRGIADIFSADRRGTAGVRELRKQWGVEEGEKVVLAVGRLAPEKSFDQLRVLKNTPGVKVVVVGDGEERAQLESLLGPEVLFTGELHDEKLADAYAAGDILFNPSQSETFCQVVQEAMASGLAVIAADVGGPRDLIVDGETGMKYTPSPDRGGEDVEARKRVERLLREPTLITQLGQNAVEAVAGRTWKSKTGELEVFYRHVTHAHPSKVANGVARLALVS